MCVIAIIGAVAVSAIAENSNEKTQLTTITRTLDISPARITTYPDIDDTYVFTIDNAVYSGFRTDYSECEVQTINFYNQTGDLMTDPTDYVFVMDIASLTLENVYDLNTSTSNTTTVTYNYCANDYIGGWTKTILNVIPGLYVIALLMAIAFTIFWILKKEGIDIGI